MTLWGQISPQLCQKLAALALADFAAGVNLEVGPLKKLAKLGTEGAHPENIWAGFIKLLPPMKLCKPFEFRCPYKTRMLGHFFRPAWMLLPHELFASIYNNYPEIWRTAVCPGVSWNYKGKPKIGNTTLKNQKNNMQFIFTQILFYM